MRIGRLHVLTDTVLQDRFDHLELSRRAIQGGAELIQFRQKEGTTRELIRTARRLREICRRARVPLLVNDRIDVAIAADADGLHLGWDDYPLPLARRMLGPHRILGASAGSVEEAIAGWRQGADYLGCGPVYPTAAKPDAGPAAGIELIRRIREAVPIPLIGIGGIKAANARAVLEAGADGIAVISAVCTSSNPEDATRVLRAILDDAAAARGGKAG